MVCERELRNGGSLASGSNWASRSAVSPSPRWTATSTWNRWLEAAAGCNSAALRAAASASSSFALKPKNAGEIVLRRIGKRIQLYCLSRLFLRLIKFA